MIFEDCAYLSTLFGSFRRNADRVAVIHPGGSLTYAELLAEVFRVARALEGLGLRRGDGVAAIAHNTPGILVTNLASQVLGCYFAGISTSAATAEQARMIEFTEVAAVVYEPALAADRSEELAETYGVEGLLSLGPSSTGTDLLALAADLPSTALTPRAGEQDIADLVFTGGSTGGKPKAAAYTFERMGELAESWLSIGDQDAADAAYRADDCRLLRCFAVTDAPGVAVLPALLHGATLVLQQGFDASAVLHAIERQRVTVLSLYPSDLYRLLDHPDVTRTDLSTLRLVVYYGAPMSPARLRQAIEVFGTVFYQIYGQSETRMLCTLQPEDHRVDRPELLRSVGRPRPGVKLEIRASTGNAAVGELGEIHARTPYRMNHYWREPHLTAETVDGDWTRTADLGYRDAAGYVYVAGRLRDVVVVGGFNCHAVEIENVLMTHPSVRAAVVVGLEDPRTGEAVHAAVVRRPGTEVSEVELGELVRLDLGELQRPRSVLFLDELPVTRSGKPDKNAVRQLLMLQGASGRGVEPR
ncbi:AMP-binding protein [Lentzea sp. JNUCC 0626]|uniref:AMP-binding protein n=1 Tax=Lentzea sp. JNUCC 0626 TaxID=3367513 RepID=UPI0037496FE3